MSAQTILLSRVITAVLALLMATPVSADNGPSETLKRAMEREMERSRLQLAREGMDRPYFIAYRVMDMTERRIVASEGALYYDQESRHRLLRVELRVGDYRFDNGNFEGPQPRYGGFAMLALEDNEQELRRQIWLATDQAYKSALEAIAGKRAALENRIRDETLPDFSAVEPFIGEDKPGVTSLGGDAARSLVIELSAALGEKPELLAAHAMLIVGSTSTHYLNSEGSQFFRRQPRAALGAFAGLQASDGRAIEDHVLAYAPTVSELPDRATLQAQVRAMGQRVVALRDAPLLERYNGPALLVGQAAAEIVLQGFAPALIAQRAPVFRSTGPTFSPGPLQDRLGARVLPRFLKLTDDPSLSQLNQRPLTTHYIVDDDAVPAAATVLVENGRLKTLLNDRTPVPDIPDSTGNQRGDAILPSNLILSSSATMDSAALEAELMALAEESGNEYGLLITRLFNPVLASGIQSNGDTWAMFGAGDAAPLLALEAYRIWPDGRRERVRHVQLPDLHPRVFRDIVAAGEGETVYTAPFSGSEYAGFSSAMELGLPEITVATPDLLFEELTLRAPTGDNPSLPVLSQP